MAKGVLCALLCASLAAAAAANDGDAPRARGFRPSPLAASARRAKAKPVRALVRTAAGEPLPSRWDSREHGWVTPVRDQGDIGACWAFAALASMEAHLLKRGKGGHDFSEKNMVNLSGYAVSPDDGGNYGMATAYLLRWGGAVAETNDAYAATMSRWTPSPALPPVARVQNVVMLPRFEDVAATNEMKAAIMEHGAVATTIKWAAGCKSTNTYYYAGSSHVDHAVAAVGWDDSFPASAFKKTPPSNGAWLIKNSWGPTWGAGGYCWVSYCDTSFGHDENSTAFVPARDDERYDAVRGYDRLGCIYDVTEAYPEDRLAAYDLQASVFTSSWGEELAAVGVFTYVYPNPYEISVYTNVTRGAASPVEGGALACRQYGTVEHAGFATIHLESPVPLADTNSFAVVYRQLGEGRSTCVSCTYVDWAYSTNAPGNCYVGYVTGAGTNAWMDAFHEADRVDATDEGWALCVKAYTRFAPAVPAGDAPAENDDGTSAMAELEAGGWPWFRELGGTFGAAAGLRGANGRSLWTSWLSGLSWADPDAGEFKASIDIVDGAPVVSWEPDLGAARTYAVQGKASLADEWSPTNSASRFFRVVVQPRQ